MIKDTYPLSLQQLAKRYRGTSTYAIRDVTLRVARGEVYGFLGANGAGKSTTIRTLLNFIQPTSGKATICGHDSVRESLEVKRCVGYLSGEVALYGSPTAAQFFAYMADLQPLKHHAYLGELVERFDVALHQQIATLSKGNRQKLGIIQAFMHEPDVLILDEPTSGLDPLMQEEFFKLVHEAKDRGAAIFLSSHNLAEAQRVCDRVGIIKHGQLIREQAIGELSDLGTSIFRIRLRTPHDIANLKREPSLKLQSQVDGSTLLMQPKGSIKAALAALGTYDIADFTTEQLNLEDEFMKFYGDEQ